MNITRGKVQAPIRAVAYGPEGIGKSTFGSKWPTPLFVDAESGTLQLEVDRVQPQSWQAMQEVVETFIREQSASYRTLVFDTADWMEKMLTESICQSANKRSIEDFGYGKGYVHVAEGWKRFLDQVARLQDATGMHVLFLAHAAMRKFEQPDEMGSYDRWEMKLCKQSSPILKEWADLVLFLNYQTIVVEADGGRKKAQGGRRVMFADHHPCWDAKNRFGLPAELPLDFAAIAGIFKANGESVKPRAATPPPADDGGLGPVNPPAGAQAAKPAVAPSAAVPTPVEDPEKIRLLGQLKELMISSGVSMPELGAELARRGIVPADANPRTYNLATLGRIVSNWDKVLANINLARTQQAA